MGIYKYIRVLRSGHCDCFPLVLIASSCDFRVHINIQFYLVFVVISFVECFVSDLELYKFLHEEGCEVSSSFAFVFYVSTVQKFQNLFSAYDVMQISLPTFSVIQFTS